MRRIFYLFLALFYVTFSFAQPSPGGVSNAVLWLDAGSGATPSGWIDRSASANNFSQSTVGLQPVYNASAINFRPALVFDGSKRMLLPSPSGFPTAASDRTIFAVASANNTTSFSWILSYGSQGTANSTFQTGNLNGTLTHAFYGSTSDINSPLGYWNQPPNTYGALSEFTLNGTTETQYDRGVVINSKSTSSPLLAASINAVVGALDNTGIEAWKGNISEVIMYNSALTAPQRNQVESYLAVKYGLSLGTTTSPVNYTASNGTVFWTASGAYQNDVFGIGTDNGSALTQTVANSQNSGVGDGSGQSTKGNLVLSAGAALANNQFLMIGHNGGSLSETPIAPGEAPLVAVGSQRIARNWRIQNTGAVGPVTLTFDMTGLVYTGGTTDPNNYRLMIDLDGDANYNTGTPAFIKPASITPNISNTGYQLNFPNVTLADNAVFTYVTQASALLLPAVWESFNVNLQSNKAILTWKTSEEVNVDHYTAEYSTDGNTFRPFATVAAANNAGTNTYTAAEDNLPSGVRYYHIKRFDKDGRFELSEVKTVRVGAGNSVQLRTNPIANGLLELNINVQQNQEAVIRVMNVDGKLLLQQHKALSGGANNVSTSITHLAPGSYFLQVQLGSQVVSRKFVRL